MAFIIEMVRGKPGASSFEVHSCSGRQWDDLLAIAREYGWKPKGTERDPEAMQHNPDYEENFTSDYAPQDWYYSKCFGDEDAKAFACALRSACAAMLSGAVSLESKSGQVLLSDEKSCEESTRLNSDRKHVLRGLAEFAERGSFAFAWDD